MHATAAGVLGLVVVVLGLLRLAPHVSGVYHDDGIYVATAKALAEGHGYTLINLPGSPPQTKYPVLYPALLAAVWRIWPDYPANLAALQGLSVLFGAAAVALGFLYTTRHRFATTRECWAASLLCATSPAFLYYTTQTLSEPLFALLLIVALWAADIGAKPGAGGRRWSVATGVALGLPFLCRSLGACVPPAALLELRQRSAAIVFTACAIVATAAPWLLWVWVRNEPSEVPALRYYTADNYLTWWIADPSIAIPGMNTLFSVTETVALPLAGMAALRFEFTWPAFLVVGILAFREGLRHFRTPLILTAFCYLFLVILWPWPPGRFLIPLLPVLTVFIVVACRKAVERFTSRSRTAVPVFLLLAVAANLVLHVRIATIVHQTGYPYGFVPDRPALWQHYNEIFAWVRTNTPPDAIIASGLDSMVFLHTGRRGFRPFVQRPTALFYQGSAPPLGTSEELVQTLRDVKAGYLLELPMPVFAEEAPFAALIQNTMAQWPDCLRPVFGVEGDERFRVYRVMHSACAERFAER